MIARFFILFILIVVLPDFYIDYRFLRPRRQISIGKRLLWWLPCLVMMVITCWMAGLQDFIPADYRILEIYMGLLGIFVIPKILFVICSFIGWGFARFKAQSALRIGEYVGIALASIVALAYIYGFTLGFNRVEVRHMDLAFGDLPEEFDGFRLVQVSDLHVGTYGGWRRAVLHDAIDSICAQQPDLICFTGDLQNIRPDEVESVRQELTRLPNVVSVLGNHDYSDYAGGTSEERRSREERMKRIQQEDLDWVLLNNAHVNLSDSVSGVRLYIVGTENDGLPPFPSKADYQKAIKGIPAGAFTIMLQHDPSAWRRHVLPQTKAQLTLSGHTHGGQLNLFGWRPTKMKYDEDYGLYEQDGRYLYVSGGVGGIVPFRLGIPGAITVITLHKK